MSTSHTYLSVSPTVGPDCADEKIERLNVIVASVTLCLDDTAKIQNKFGWLGD